MPSDVGACPVRKRVFHFGSLCPIRMRCGTSFYNRAYSSCRLRPEARSQRIALSRVNRRSAQLTTGQISSSIGQTCSCDRSRPWDGRSHALRLAEEGADLVLVDICESLPDIDYPLAIEADLAETASLVADLGRRCVSRVVDIRDDVAMRQVVDDAVDDLGGLDAAVANAGVLTVGSWDRRLKSNGEQLSTST